MVDGRQSNGGQGEGYAGMRVKAEEDVWVGESGVFRAMDFFCGDPGSQDLSDSSEEDLGGQGVEDGVRKEGEDCFSEGGIGILAWAPDSDRFWQGEKWWESSYWEGWVEGLHEPWSDRVDRASCSIYEKCSRQEVEHQQNGVLDEEGLESVSEQGYGGDGEKGVLWKVGSGKKSKGKYLRTNGEGTQETARWEGTWSVQGSDYEQKEELSEGSEGKDVETPSLGGGDASVAVEAKKMLEEERQVMQDKKAMLKQWLQENTSTQLLQQEAMYHRKLRRTKNACHVIRNAYKAYGEALRPSEAGHILCQC
ncbi:unnamed protein product [Choristocarpus tenellus]